MTSSKYISPKTAIYVNQRLLLGLSGATSKYFCKFCTITKDLMSDTSRKLSALAFAFHRQILLCLVRKYFFHLCYLTRTLAN